MPAKKGKKKEEEQVKILFMVHLPIVAVLVGVPFVTDVSVETIWPVWGIYIVAKFMGWLALKFI